MFNWSEFGFGMDMKKYRGYYKKNLNSQICNNLAVRCFRAFEKMEEEFIKDQYRSDEDKVNPCVHYKRKDSLKSLCGSQNTTGIRFILDDEKKAGLVKWQCLEFSIDLAKCTLYEWKALQSEICYCAVKREKIKGKWKYYIQLTLKGHVPDKFNKQTGELKRQLGKGNVGLYFTSTSLTVSTEDGVKTYPLEIKIMRIRKLNCCRRWIHPDVQQIQTTTMKMEPAKKKVKSKDGIFQKLIKNIVLNFTKSSERNVRKRNCCRKSLQMKSLRLVMYLTVIRWILNFFKET